jgi:hypothetical protein
MVTTGETPMSTEKRFTRMLDKEHKPTEEEIEAFIGTQGSEAWREVKRFVEDNYAIQPETTFYGKKYGWTVRYRKSRKTLCSLYPEKGAFTVLIVLGRKESEKVLTIRDALSTKVNELIGTTAQRHDGRWLWIRVTTTKDADDVKKLLRVKKRPKKT